MKRIVTICAALALLCLCWSAPVLASSQGGDVLAKVGDKEITREFLDHIIETIPEESRVPFLTPDGRKKILEEVISFMLFAEAAKAEGMNKEPAIKDRLKYAATEYLAREYFRRQQAKAPPISEEDLKAYYESHKAEFKPPREIKARHILVRTEAKAKKVMEKLDNGAKFEDLAKKESIDPAAAMGGRLLLSDGREWLPKGTFEKSFEYELFKIPEGQYGGPIKTQFGWHVLKVEEKRQPSTPSFVQVRATIRNRLQDQKNNEIHKKVTEELKKKFPVKEY